MTFNRKNAKISAVSDFRDSRGRSCSVKRKEFTFITRRPFWSPWGIKALSLHCLCPSSLTLNERFDGQNLLFLTLSDMGLLIKCQVTTKVHINFTNFAIF